MFLLAFGKAKNHSNYKQKRETEFFSLIFQWLQHDIYDYIGSIRDPLKQELALKFCRNQNKVVSILTESHINHDQIHRIGNNWLGFNFFSPGDSQTKG